MMEKFYGKVRRAVGFTMAEVLIVVAILAILLTLAMPNVLAYFRELRLTELDDNARTVFLAAQNRLTALVNSGEADKLEGTAVPAAPGGGGGSETPAVPVGLYMLSSREPGMDLLLPAGSIEPSLTAGHYVIYYSPTSGAVYSVWYCDRADGWGEYTQHTDKGDRLKQSVLVGYYGDSEGNIIDRAEVGQLPIPKVTLKNAEELRLDIEMTFTGTEIDPKNVTLLVKINGVTSRAETTPLNVKFNDGVNKTAIVLDSLKDHSTFPVENSSLLNNNDVYGGPFKTKYTSFTPGEDIQITVTVSYTPGAGGKDFTDQTVSVKGNSLFAFVGTDPATGAKTANIAYGRHLQNLNADLSGVTGITAAVQVREIDFEKTVDVKDIESWQATYVGKSFVPIESGELLSYDGNKLPIRNMTAGDASTANAGLFGEIKGIKSPVALRNIVLVDCKAASSSDTGNVGTLAGTVENVTVSGCEVYLENKKAEDGSPVILLDGGNVGGLIGQANGDCTIKSSFASTNERGADVGGLIGAGKADITGCYAAGYLTGTGNVGGLVGSAGAGAKVTDSYAAGIIAGEAAVNGLSGGNVTNSYSAVRYGNKVTTVTLGADVYCIKQPGITYNGGKPCTADELKAQFKGDAWYQMTGDANPAYAVFPYKQTADTESLIPSYPYPMLKNDAMPVLHYGDWLVEKEKINGYFAYYEKYEGEIYGFHTNYSPLGGTSNINFLAKDGFAVKDGYAFVSNEKIDSLEVTVDDKSYNISEPTECTVDGTKYYIYELPYDAIDIEKVVPTTTYISVSIGGNNYWFNPHFACEAWNENKIKFPNVQIIVRTARQLANVSKYTLDATHGDEARVWTYEQQLDIDFSKYNGWTEFTAGRNADIRMFGAVLTGGSYKGNGHFIKNLYMNGGLFSSVKDGTLKNIRLVNVSVEAAANGIVGGLVDKLDGGTVTDCGIYAEDAEDYDIFTVASGSDNSSYAGGLIGTASNNSKISKSFAAVRVSGAKAGGFACELNGVTVEDCYSGGHTVNGIYDSGDPNVSCAKNGSGEVGGFAVTANNTTFKGKCYSTCSVGDGSNSSNLKKAALFAGGNYTIAEGADAYALGKVFGTNGAEVSATEDIEGVKTGASVPSAMKPVKAVPYDTTLGNVYPYANGIGEHHGDWPGSAIVGFFYREKEGEAYNFYILLWEKGEADTNWHALGEPGKTEPTLIDTLCYEYHGINDVPAITDTGYGYFSITIPGSTVTFSGGTSGGSVADDIQNALKIALKNETGRSFDEGYTFAFGSITGSGNKTATMNHETVSVTVNVDFAAMIATNGGQAYNLGTGKEVTIPKNSGDFGNAGTPYNVRTLTQLGNVGNSDYVNKNKTFKQGHDLNAAAVSGYKPIGTESTPFKGTYDGDGYRILELSITAEGYAGLFGVADGATIENVIMYSQKDAKINVELTERVSIFKDRMAVAGAILGSGSNTTVTNCAVAGYKITITNRDWFAGWTSNIWLGGIAGELKGASTISKCETYVDIDVNIDATAWTGIHVYIGGIVGNISSTGPAVTQCCTGGTEKANGGSGIFSGSTTYLGGIAGNAANGTTISECYTYMTGLDYAIEGSGKSVTNCAYYGTTVKNATGATYQTTIAALRSWANIYGYKTPVILNGEHHALDGNTLAIVNVNYKYDSATGERTSGFVFYGKLPE